MAGAHHHHHRSARSQGAHPAAPLAFATHDEPHAHAHAGSASAATARALTFVLLITAGFAGVEAIAGWLAGSLALLSDAGHMVTDAMSLGIALFAQRLSMRPPSPRASYGYARAEVLAAFVNALALVALVGFIVVEAVRRLLEPAPVAGGAVLGVAGVGLVVNLVAAYILSRASQSLNTRGALLHVLSDMLGSIAAMLAGAVVLFTGWTPIDPILSMVVAVLILRSTWRLFSQSTGVLMEGVPSHLDYEQIGYRLSRVAGVHGVHDLHIWHMGSDDVALSAHLMLADGSRWPTLLAEAQLLLLRDFGIRHVTLQPSWPAPPVDGKVIPIAPDPASKPKS